MTNAKRQLQHLFAENGELAQRFPGFKPRIQQEQLALDIQQAIEEKSVLIAEAGTGTGKTLCLLCSTLAYIKQHKLNVIPISEQKQQQQMKRGKLIYRPWQYASRRTESVTHTLCVCYVCYSIEIVVLL